MPQCCNSIIVTYMKYILPLFGWPRHGDCNPSHMDHNVGYIWVELLTAVLVLSMFALHTLRLNVCRFDLDNLNPLWPLTSGPSPSAADSVTFEILPYGPQQDIVQVYCSRGSHEGKYLLVNSNNEVITGATTDGDSVFLRQNAVSLRSPLLTITLTPVNVPTHYVSFHAESGKAQLETELTDRSRLPLVDHWPLHVCGGNPGSSCSWGHAMPSDPPLLHTDGTLYSYTQTLCIRCPSQ